MTRIEVFIFARGKRLGLTQFLHLRDYACLGYGSIPLSYGRVIPRYRDRARRRFSSPQMEAARAGHARDSGDRRDHAVLAGLALAPVGGARVLPRPRAG